MKIIKVINDLALKLNMILICSVVLVILWSAFARLTTVFSPLWVESIATMIFLWFGIISINKSIISGEEASLPPVIKFNSKIQLIIDYLLKGLTIAFAMYMIYYGIDLSIIAGQSTLGGIELSSSLLYLPIPICGFLIFINIVFRA